MSCKRTPREARKLARHIVRDLVRRYRHDTDPPDNIKVDIVPRRWSVFDRARLFVGDIEVWLPLLQRLKLRRALRRKILREAYGALYV